MCVCDLVAIACLHQGFLTVVFVCDGVCVCVCVCVMVCVMVCMCVRGESGRNAAAWT